MGIQDKLKDKALGKLKDAFTTGSDKEAVAETVRAGGRGVGNLIAGLKKKLGKSKADYITMPGIVQDVIRNYRWSVKTPNQKYIDQVPSIKLTEFQPEDAPVLAEILYNIEVGADFVEGSTANDDPYNSLYRGQPTGNTYIFPYFSTYHHNLTNSWGESDSKVAEGAQKVRKFVAGVVGVLERAGVEKRRIYQGTNRPTYSFSFMLYNTIDVGDIQQNYALITTLINNNLLSKTSAMTLTSPCFYEVDIPGVRYSPAAVIQTLDIENIGQLTRYDNMNIPDAWKVTINIEELMVESKQIFNGVRDEGKKVRVIHPFSSKEEDALKGKSIEAQNKG